MYNVVGGDGQVYGPVGTDILIEWCQEGRIVARTNLMDPISGRVLRAEDLPELRDILLPAPPPMAAEPPVITPDIPQQGTFPNSTSGQPFPQTTYQSQPQLHQQMPQPQMPQPQMPQPQMPQLQMPQQQMPQQQMPTYFAATQVNAYSSPPTNYTPAGQIGQAQIPGQAPLPGQMPGTYPQQQPMPMVQVNNVVSSYQPAPYPVLQYVTPPKSKATALLLCFFFGPLGVHRFYLGHTTSGAVMAGGTVLTLGTGLVFTGLWAFIDFILICVGSLNDKQGQPLV